MIWKENGYFRIKRIIEIIFYYVKSFEKKKRRILPKHKMEIINISESFALYWYHVYNTEKIQSTNWMLFETCHSSNLRDDSNELYNRFVARISFFTVAPCRGSPSVRSFVRY